MNPQQKSRMVTLTIAGVLGVMLCLWTYDQFQESREPQCGGKPLRFWVRLLYGNDGVPVYGDGHVQKAFLELGTNAAPVLAKALVHPASGFRIRCSPLYSACWSRLPRPLARFLPQPYSPDGARARAYQILMNLGTSAQVAASQLIVGIRTGSVETRRYCAEILLRAKPNTAAVFHALRAGLKDADDFVRGYCFSAICEIPFPSELAVPILTNWLADSAPGTRYRAAQALGKHTDDAKKIIPLLIDALKQGQVPPVTAVNSLHRLGYRALEAVPVLMKSLESSLAEGYDALGVCSALALLQAEPQAVVPILTQTLTAKANDPRVRSDAAAYLGRYGRAASTAIPALVERLKDKDEWWYVRESVAKAIGLIGVAGEQASAARSALREACHDTHPDVRKAAEQAIKAISLSD